jgi:hypothetical protein
MTADAKASPAKDTATVTRCSRCGAQPRLVQQMLDARNGGTLRMYECDCGEQTWHHTTKK